MTRAIKICGLSTPETVNAAIEGGASHVGFIFFAKSPRNISLETATKLAGLARHRADSVAVTVDAHDTALDRIVHAMRPAALQLHGGESIERVGAIRRRYGLPVIKAFAIRDAADIERAMAYRDVADRLLFDAKPPEGADLPGGNGVSFDWSLLAALDGAVDYMLSGGLNAGNIAEALRRTHAPGIDVSSGVESAPGIKDIGLIRSFLAMVATSQPASRHHA